MLKWYTKSQRCILHRTKHVTQSVKKFHMTWDHCWHIHFHISKQGLTLHSPRKHESATQCWHHANLACFHEAHIFAFSDNSTHSISCCACHITEVHFWNPVRPFHYFLETSYKLAKPATTQHKHINDLHGWSASKNNTHFACRGTSTSEHHWLYGLGTAFSYPIYPRHIVTYSLPRDAMRLHAW